MTALHRFSLGRPRLLPLLVVVFVVLVAVLSWSTTRDRPAEAGVSDGFAQIDIGASHSCGVTTVGDLYCWGGGDQGQLGDGTVDTLISQPIPRPVDPPAGETWVHVATGQYHTCAIDSTGAAWCWGLSYEGQVGDGVTPPVAFTPVPARVEAPGVQWRSLTAARGHTCGIDTTGAAWCWGSDAQGQLGDGATSTADQAAPVPVATAPGTTWAMIDAGADSANNFGGDTTCGITTDGAAYCWGDDAEGALGNGDVLVEDQASPSPVEAPPGTQWASIRVGLHHTCGVTTTGGGFCWGSNDSQQLGIGAAPDQASPVAVSPPAGVTWVDIDAGTFHSCGVDADGGAWCWGAESNGGEFGDGEGPAGIAAEPVPVATPTGIAWAEIVTSPERHTCARATDGSLWCWGSDAWGKLGDGTPTGSLGERHEPSRVADGTDATDQTISFGALTARTFDQSPFFVAATASSGLPVTFAAEGACTVAGDVVTLTGLGLCTVTASQAGDGVWGPAAPVVRPFEVLAIPAALTVSGFAQTYDGMPKTITATTTPIGLATTVTYDGSTLAPTTAGSYEVVVALDEPLHSATPQTGTLTIAPGAQAIAFPAPSPATVEVGGSLLVGPTASSGLPVEVAVTGPCTLWTGILTTTAIGTCTVTASQPGDGNWLAASPVAHDIEVTGLPGTISVDDWSQTYDGSPRPVSVTTDPPGLDVAVTYDGSGTPPTDAGSYAVVATVVDDTYAAGPVEGTLVVARAEQTVDLPPLADAAYGDAPVPLEATATSGLPVAYAAAGRCAIDGAHVVLGGAGECTVTATQPGDGNRQAAPPVETTFTITPAPIALALSGPTTATLVGTDATFTATVAGPVLPTTGIVTFAVDGEPSAPVPLVGATATWTTDDLPPGPSTVTATYDGTADLAPATSVPTTHDVVTAPLAVVGLPDEVRVDQVVDVVARGFHPGEDVTFTLHSDPVVVGTAVADGFGDAALRFAVPDVDPSRHELIAVGERSGSTASTVTSVVNPDPTPTDPTVPSGSNDPTTPGPVGSVATDGGALARTGSDLLLSASVLGLVLIAVGSAVRRTAKPPRRPPPVDEIRRRSAARPSVRP